jgi:uncharacterized protein YqjF (DUF2071 family)
MRQSWNDLLFAHWPIAAARIRELVPRELELDLLDGDAWVAVTPFHMDGIRMRGAPPVPGLSAFPELNVRTYVKHNGVPGVFFFSLDAGSLLAVFGARATYSLPYFYATMRLRISGREVTYSSFRRTRNAEMGGKYRGTGELRQWTKDSREYFLTERYRLYTVRRSKVMHAGIHHIPWPLEEATAEFEVNTMARAAGIELPTIPPLLHFSKRVEVLIWPLRADVHSRP